MALTMNRSQIVVVVRPAMYESKDVVYFIRAGRELTFADIAKSILAREYLDALFLSE